MKAPCQKVAAESFPPFPAGFAVLFASWSADFPRRAAAGCEEQLGGFSSAAELEIRAFASELGHRLIITVLAAANLSTIKNAVRQAERFEEIYIAVDLIGLDPEAAIAHAKLAEECGADICIAHLAIDEQLRGQEVNPDWVRTLSRELSIPIAVAGGLNAQTAPMVVEAGASIIIVGSAITKSADPQAETRRIRRAITHAALQTSR